MEEFLVKNAPATVYYIPNFISVDEEQRLMREVYDSPKPKWTQLKNRRLQNWGGVPQPKGMIAEPIPDWLNDCCKKIFSLGVFADKMPNHILVNEYLAGQGIMPHLDGLLYHPTVSTISLGSHTMLDFYKPINDSSKEEENGENSNDSRLLDRYLFSIYLEPRSLVVLQDDMYKKYLHGIKEIVEDSIDREKVLNYDRIDSTNLKLIRDTRISLTIRHVPKIFKANLNSLIFNKKK